MDTTQILSTVSDTLNIVIHNAPNVVTNAADSSSFDLKSLYVPAASLAGAVIGAAITIWYKSKDFENFRSNLNLQKQLFEETKQNNENKIKAEIVRLRDLRKEYELNLKKHSHDMLRDTLTFASQNTHLDQQKIEALKAYNAFINKIAPTPRYDFEDSYEYEEWLVTETYFNLDVIIKELTDYLSNYSHVFTTVNESIRACKSKANMILADVKAEIEFPNEFPEYEQIFTQFNPILELYNGLNSILEEMIKDFKELEGVRKNFITAEVKKHNDAATT